MALRGNHVPTFKPHVALEIICLTMETGLEPELGAALGPAEPVPCPDLHLVLGVRPQVLEEVVAAADAASRFVATA